MFSAIKKTTAVTTIVFIALFCLGTGGYAENQKIGYVDLKRIFFEYEKEQGMENELAGLTEEKKEERTEKVEEITRLRDEIELLSEDARTGKQSEIEGKLSELQIFDKGIRKELLTKRNDIFREVVNDIEEIVNEIGKREGYAYILDSRSVMYADDAFDLTEEVIKKLNKE